MRIINVSPHLLMDTARCKTWAWTRHVKGYTSRGDAIKMVTGQAFHKAMEVFFDPQADGQNATAALTAFHTVFDPVYERLSADQLDLTYTPRNLDALLSRWLEMHPPELLPWRRVIAVETAFVSRKWWVGPNGDLHELEKDDVLGEDDTLIQLIVRPDLLAEDNDGYIRWVDTKSTGWHISDRGWRNALRLSSQTQLYSDAVRQKYGEKGLLGGWISALELNRVPSDPNKTCGVHKRKYADCGPEHTKFDFVECLTTEARVERAVLDAEDAIRDYIRLLDVSSVTTLPMDGTEVEACRFCPASKYCLDSRPENFDEVIEAYEMVYSPYAVEEGTR